MCVWLSAWLFDQAAKRFAGRGFRLETLSKHRGKPNLLLFPAVNTLNPELPPSRGTAAAPQGSATASPLLKLQGTPGWLRIPHRPKPHSHLPFPGPSWTETRSINSPTRLRYLHSTGAAQREYCVNFINFINFIYSNPAVVSALLLTPSPTDRQEETQTQAAPAAFHPWHVLPATSAPSVSVLEQPRSGRPRGGCVHQPLALLPVRLFSESFHRCQGQPGP